MQNSTLVSEVGKPQALLLPSGQLSMDITEWIETFKNFVIIHWDDVTKIKKIA
ncbi:hypothetical protein A3Q56_06164, partial [Intoshia linei]